MNFIRDKILKNNSRIKNSEYNLDLSYITPRILAMSFPGNGLLDQFYHNNINDISKFLEENHGKGHYFLFNLSGITYDRQRFGNNVKKYDWEDHAAPPLEDLFNVCMLAYDYLKKDDKNVCVFNCLAGKGRTGTTITCLFLFCKLIDSAEKAIDYFSIKRFGQVNKGVQQPSQLRYVKYFYKIVTSDNFEFNTVLIKIKDIKFAGVNDDKGNPIFIKCTIKSNFIKDSQEFLPNLVNNKDIIIYGDTIFEFNTEKKNLFGIKNKTICRVLINTNFLDFFKSENEVTVSYQINDCDPRELQTKEKYQKIFIEITYERILNNEQQNSNVSKQIKGFYDRQMNRIKELNNKINQWKLIRAKLTPYEINKRFFNDKENNVESVLKGTKTKDD